MHMPKFSRNDSAAKVKKKVRGFVRLCAADARLRRGLPPEARHARRRGTARGGPLAQRLGATFPTAPHPRLRSFADVVRFRRFSCVVQVSLHLGAGVSNVRADGVTIAPGPTRIALYLSIGSTLSRAIIRRRSRSARTLTGEGQRQRTLTGERQNDGRTLRGNVNDRFGQNVNGRRRAGNRKI